MLTSSSLSTVPLMELLVAFFVTYFSTPVFIKIFSKRGITGIDVHKANRPVRAEMCGLSAVIGFTASLLTASLFLPANVAIQATILTVSLVSAVGVYDKLFGLQQRRKVALLLLAAAPMTWAFKSQSVISLPLIGTINLGILYPILLVPVGISAAGNLTNMLAGFNGLEAGLGTVALAAIAIASYISGRAIGVIISIPMVAALCAFLFFNWYPAKAFPGDAGTLAIGSALACAVIAAGIEFAGVIVLLPHIIDFFAKLLDTKGKSHPFGQRTTFGDTVVDSDGTLHPPKYMSLSHFLMQMRPMTEKKLVKTFMLFESVFGVIAVTLIVLVK